MGFIKGEKVAWVEYHSKDWELLVSLGYVTMFILEDGFTAQMLFAPKWYN